MTWVDELKVDSFLQIVIGVAFESFQVSFSKISL